MTRRSIGLAAGAVLVALLCVVAPPAVHLARTWRADARHDLPATPRGFADDASHLDATRVASIVDIPADDDAAIAAIRAAFERARREHRGVSVAGFRHSMGGQTIAPGGIVLNMLPHDHLRYDRKTTHLRVGAGATWDLVIPYLDHFGRAVAVMQSDSPFSVGGSLSVNCHGWQPLEPPIASTVEALLVVTPDGALHRCSRTVDPELFSLVLGGYGLFGVIVDAELRTVPNQQYSVASFHVPLEQYEATFDREVRSRNDAGLAYGRIGIVEDGLAGDALLTVFRNTGEEPELLRWREISPLERLLFRGSVRSGFGKRLRWWSETHLGRVAYWGMRTRNDLMDGDIEQYVNHSAAERDILQEYFVPRGTLAPFLRDLERVVRTSGAELLNVTLRDVRRDDISALPYARGDRFAVVLFFEQRPTEEGERQMRQLTRVLVDAALKRGGTYYLPYRLHESPEQFRAAYPQCGAFFAAKRRRDPEGLLTNRWYEAYGHACD